MKPGPAEVYLSRWPAKSDTHKTLRSALNRVAGVLVPGSDANSYPWHELRYDTMRAIPSKLEGVGLGPVTINKHLSAVRGVLEVAKKIGLMSEADHLLSRIKNVRGSSDRADPLRDDELDAIKAALPKLPVEDAAMIAVMVGAGARRIEVVKIRCKDYNAVTGRIRLYGKGKKPRRVPVGKTWRSFVEAHFATLTDDQLAFPGDRRRVSYIVKKLSETSGVDFTPHDLRRAFGTYICKVADVGVAQRLLGHTDVKTTLIYDLRGEEAEDDAVKDW